MFLSDAVGWFERFIVHVWGWEFVFGCRRRTGGPISAVREHGGLHPHHVFIAQIFPNRVVERSVVEVPIH
jgi:hypothetical protein